MAIPTPDIISILNLNQPNLSRSSDNYINATLLCKILGRKYKKWKESKIAREFITELSKYVYENPTNSIRMGIPADRFQCTLEEMEDRLIRRKHPITWVDPRIAFDIIHWSSARFRIRVSEWMYTLLTQLNVKLTVEERNKALQELTTNHEESDESSDEALVSQELTSWKEKANNISEQLVLRDTRISEMSTQLILRDTRISEMLTQLVLRDARIDGILKQLVLFEAQLKESNSRELYLTELNLKANTQLECFKADQLEISSQMIEFDKYVLELESRTDKLTLQKRQFKQKLITAKKQISQMENHVSQIQKKLPPTLKKAKYQAHFLIVCISEERGLYHVIQSQKSNWMKSFNKIVQIQKDKFNIAITYKNIIYHCENVPSSLKIKNKLKEQSKDKYIMHNADVELILPYTIEIFKQSVDDILKNPIA